MGSVARVTEITAQSDKGFQEAIELGVARAHKTLRHVRGAWVKGQQLDIEEGKIKGYRVDLMVTFLLDDEG